jgi:hypothetical protein
LTMGRWRDEGEKKKGQEEEEEDIFIRQVRQ